MQYDLKSQCQHVKAQDQAKGSTGNKATSYLAGLHCTGKKIDNICIEIMRLH